MVQQPNTVTQDVGSNLVLAVVSAFGAPSLTSLTSTAPLPPQCCVAMPPVRLPSMWCHVSPGGGGVQTSEAEEPLTGLLHSGVNANRGVWDHLVAPPPLLSEIL